MHKLETLRKELITKYPEFESLGELNFQYMNGVNLGLYKENDNDKTVIVFDDQYLESMTDSNILYMLAFCGIMLNECYHDTMRNLDEEHLTAFSLAVNSAINRQMEQYPDMQCPDYAIKVEGDHTVDEMFEVFKQHAFEQDNNYDNLNKDLNKMVNG